MTRVFWTALAVVAVFIGVTATVAELVGEANVSGHDAAAGWAALAWVLWQQRDG